MTIGTSIIKFNVRENFCSEKRKAVKINDWLAVAWTYDGNGDGKYKWKIYRMDTGLPLIPNLFEDQSDAIKVANMIADAYAELFDIWIAEPEFEMLRVAQYTAKNGEEVYNKVCGLPEYVKKGDIKWTTNGVV